MKFLKYLNEETNEEYYQGWLKNLKEDCQPYLNDIKKFGMKWPFWRGMNVSKHYPGTRNIRKDRFPKGMSEDKAEFLNNWLEEHGHLRRDKSVMATSSAKHTGKFGETCMIFPIGDYKFTYVKMDDINYYNHKDIYGAIETAYLLSDYNKSFFKTIKTDKNKIKNSMINIYGEDVVKNMNKIMNDNFVSNKNLKEAYDEKWEIWFGGSQYYYFPFYSLFKEDFIRKMEFGEYA